MKKFTLLLMVCLLSFSIQAQLRKVSSFEPISATVSAEATAPIFTTLGYSSSDITSGIGVGAEIELSAAIYFPGENLKNYIGKNVYAVRIGLSADVTDFSIFATNSLTEEYFYTQELDDAEEGWVEIRLDTPLEITEAGFYIGYTATGMGQIGFSGTRNQNANWIRIEDGEWQNVYSSNFGSVCLQILVLEGEAPEREMGIVELKNTYAITGESFTISGTVVNNTIEPVTSYEISYQIEGREKVTEKIETSLLLFDREVFTFKVDEAVAERGTSEVVVTIEKVNDGEDELVSNNSLTAPLICMDYSYPKKVVVEQGTSVYCTFCPRGIVGMGLMREKYPDTFIGIAVHNNFQGSDPMAVNAYTPLGNFFTGNPMCVVNRKSSLVGDPYYDIEKMYSSEIEIPSEIGITLKANFVENNNSEIEVVADVIFGFSSETAGNDYRLAYVVIENGVTGYFQYNGFAGSGIPMGGYENLPHPVPASIMVFDEIARGIYSYNGLEGSISESVIANEALQHTYTITLPNTIQQLNELEVIAMVLDYKTGQIVNGDKVMLDAPTSIKDNNVSTLNAIILNGQNSLNIEIESEENVTVELYNLEGVLLNSFVASINGKETVNIPVNNSGAYIIKLSNSKDSLIKKIIM